MEYVDQVKEVEVFDLFTLLTHKAKTNTCVTWIEKGFCVRKSDANRG